MTKTYTLSPTTDRILAELEGHTRDAPGWLDEIAPRLDVPPDLLWDAVESLQDAGRIVRCDITRNGQTRVALWPTGMIRPGYTAEQAIIRKHTAARAAKEPAMTDTQTTPEPATTTTPRRLAGDVQREILAFLDPLTEAEAMSPPAIHERITLAGSIGSTRKTLQRLAGLGLIGSRVEGTGTGRRAYYWGLQGGRVHLVLPTTAAEPADDSADEDQPVDPSIIPAAVQARIVAALNTLRAYCGNQSWGWDDSDGYYLQAFDRRFVAQPEDFYDLYTSLDMLAYAEDVTG